METDCNHKGCFGNPEGWLEVVRLGKLVHKREQRIRYYKGKCANLRHENAQLRFYCYGGGSGCYPGFLPTVAMAFRLSTARIRYSLRAWWFRLSSRLAEAIR